jgi:hypothetical protein
VKSNRQIYRELRQQLCMDCVAAGRDGVWPEVCMEFDHVLERGVKRCSVKDLLGKSQREFLEEVAKCDVVCRNCHTMRTSRRGKTPEQIENIKRGLRKPGVLEKKNASLKESTNTPEKRAQNSFRNKQRRAAV